MARRIVEVFVKVPFKFVFRWIVVLTIGFAAAALWLSSQDPPTELQVEMFALCRYVVIFFVGFLGGGYAGQRSETK